MGLGNFSISNFSTKGLMDPNELGYTDSVEIIKEEFSKIKRSYIKIGFYLKHIKEKELYVEAGYKNIWDCALDVFGIKQDSASRFIQACEIFSVDGDSPVLDDKYAEFSKSQLFEMLPMSEEQREDITPDMTVKNIREKKKENKKEPSDREIKMAISWFGLYPSKQLCSVIKIKEYMTLTHGKTHSGGGKAGFGFQCSPRGIIINNSDELTWFAFAQRVFDIIGNFDDKVDASNYIHEELESENDNQIEGQSYIMDYPEVIPDDYVVVEQDNVIEHEDGEDNVVVEINGHNNNDHPKCSAGAIIEDFKKYTMESEKYGTAVILLEDAIRIIKKHFYLDTASDR